MPLIVSWPGRIAAGATSDEVVGCIDFYPTLLDLLGIKANPKQIIDGVSIAPVLLGTGTLSSRVLFHLAFHPLRERAAGRLETHPHHRRHPRTENSAKSHQLYNLKDDLGETTNLARENKEKVAELSALIDRYVKQTGALYPKPNPAYDPQATSPKNKGQKRAAKPSTKIE